MDLHHFLHPESLSIIEITNKMPRKYTCFGCLDSIYGPAYVTKNGAFVMHKSCAELPRQIQKFAFHPHPLLCNLHDLIICDRCENLRECYISYRCMNCPLDLDFNCARAILDDAEFQLVKHDEKRRVRSSINHFCHQHQLTRCKVSNLSLKIEGVSPKYDFCVVCLKDILPCELGVVYEPCLIYTCLSCRLILHESCVNDMPMEVRSLFHPQHLLLPRPIPPMPDKDFKCYACTRKISYISFFCSECDVYFHASCAKYQTQVVKHHCHPHHLLHLGKSIKRWRTCNACRKRCDDSSFSCIRCDFHMHPECVQLPPKIQHPCHLHSLALKSYFVEDESGEYYCDTCETERNVELHVYCCEECNYTTHIYCVISEVKPIKDMLFGPDRQRKEITYGVDEEMSSNEKTIHKVAFHPHPLRLYHDPSAKFVCDGCGELCSGSSYKCNSCLFNLDIKCASLNEEISKDKAQEGREIKNTTLNFSHYHQLSRCKIFGEYSCMACKQVCFGLTYTCLVCMFFLHESCLEDMPADGIWSHFHQHILLPRPLNMEGYRYNCYVCLEDVEFASFSCIPCHIFMHYSCAKYQIRPLRHKCHIHNLLQLGKSSLPRGSRCTLCDTLNLENNIFRCSKCEFYVHLGCIPLPFRVKHKRHLHTLTLTSFSIDDDSKEYYCDACEMERNPELNGYSCEECNFIAHIDCIISEVEPPEEIFGYLQHGSGKGEEEKVDYPQHGLGKGKEEKVEYPQHDRGRLKKEIAEFLRFGYAKGKAILKHMGNLSRYRRSY